MVERIGIIGAGSWGTAVAINLALAKNDVMLWARRQEHVEEMVRQRKNTEYLKDVMLPDGVHVTGNLAELVASSSILVLATPSQVVRSVSSQVGEFVREEQVLVSLAKGVEKHSLKLSSEVLLDCFPRVPRAHVGVLYGPSHAEEVAQELPATIVASAYEIDTAVRIQHAFRTASLRVYMNPDIVGVQVGGSVKNVMAIAAGISDGVGFGDNAKAAIITRGISEIRRLGVAMGAHPETFAGLSGIGDLVVTCMSGLSRNRYLGEQIGKGRSLDEIRAEMNMVAEGVETTRSVRALASKYSVEMPISESVHAILFENKKPLQAVRELMGREARKEDWLA